MQVSLTFTVAANAEGRKALERIVASIGTGEGVIGASATLGAVTDEEAPKSKRGRPAGSKNKKKAEPVEAEDEDEAAADEEVEGDEDVEGDDGGGVEGDEENEIEDEDEVEEDDEPEEKPAKKAKANGKSGPSLEDMIAAFKKYVGKHGRDAGMKVLKKYKADNVRGLPKEKYAEILKAIKA